MLAESGTGRKLLQTSLEDDPLPIEYEKRDGVAYITLTNPGKANILDKPTSDAIPEA